MPVHRYRSVEDMPPPWRDPDDQGNLALVAELMALYQRLMPRRRPGVRKFRSHAELKNDQQDLVLPGPVGRRSE